MEKKNYNNMYKSKAKAEADAETPAKIMEEAAPVEEPAKKEVKEPKQPRAKKLKTGIVIGGLNLNVRKAPGGEIIGSLSPDTGVVIAEDLGDWYKITDPEGYVMKKFIEA